MVTVAKFGGSSLADASQIKKVIEIVKADPERKFVVVSAYGRRTPEDRKCTDALLHWQKNAGNKEGKAARQEVIDRYSEIAQGLDVQIDVDEELGRHPLASLNMAASRGEYLMAKIVAQALGSTFVDAKDIIRFDRSGNCHWMLTFDMSGTILRQAAQAGGVVVPGFYGADLNGNQIITFSRGGSDVTGAIVARAVEADLYENWTDVNGIQSADPRIVPAAMQVERATYAEVREMSYMGATVLHPLALYPVSQVGIPTHIKNTNDPSHPGTLIVGNGHAEDRTGKVIGVAGRKGFAIIKVDKVLMNEELGIARKVLSVLERHGINLDHMPGGIDTMSIVVDGEALPYEKTPAIIKDIKEECGADDVRISRAVAMIATVGKGMVHSIGMAARVCGAVAGAGINIRVINQGASELSIIIGVDDADYENAIRAIHRACIET